MLKSIPNSLAAISLLAGIPFTGVAKAQSPRYSVIDLGPANSPFAQATWLNGKNLVTGSYTTPSGTSHAFLWYKGQLTDIGQQGLGGPNNAVGGVNASDQVIGVSETSATDPQNENFCGYGTGHQCLAFLWQDGLITPLPTLGGTNDTFGAINNRGEIAGIAETNTQDPECPTGVSVNGTGPQQLDFEAVVWGPGPDQVRALPPLPGDSVGMAFGINDIGQVVGISGRCGNSVLPGFAAGPHAVLWDTDGSVQDLGSLGGTTNTSLLAVGNVAFAINNRDEVTGQSALPGSLTGHPFFWSRATGMQDLGLLPGDFIGAGLDLNDEGEIVGASISAPGPLTGNPRAFLWRKGTMTDLNTLIPPDSPLQLLTAFAINDAGDIVGFAFVTAGPEAGEIHGFLATRCASNAAAGACGQPEAGKPRRVIAKRGVALTDKARKQLLRWELRVHRAW